MMSSSYPSLADHRRSAALGGVLLLALLVYCNTLLNGFVYDDHFQVEQSPYVHSFKYVDKILTTTVWSFQGLEGKTNYYRPLMILGFLVCNKVFQAYPFGFHLVNLLLNCVVVCLVFLGYSPPPLEEIVPLVAAAYFPQAPMPPGAYAWLCAMPRLAM